MTLPAYLVRKYASRKPAPPIDGESRDPTFFSALAVDLAPFPPRISRLGHRRIDRTESARACAALGTQPVHVACAKRGGTKEPPSKYAYHLQDMGNGDSRKSLKMVSNHQSWLPAAIPFLPEGSKTLLIGLGSHKRNDKVQKDEGFTLILPGTEERQAQNASKNASSDEDKPSVLSPVCSERVSILKTSTDPSIAIQATIDNTPTGMRKESLLKSPRHSKDQGLSGTNRSLSKNSAASSAYSTWTVDKDPSRAVPSWVEKEAMALLSEVQRPSPQEIAQIAAEQHVPKREALTIFLVGKEQSDKLKELSETVTGSVLHLESWLRSDLDLAVQFVAAALTTIKAQRINGSGSLIQNTASFHLWLDLQCLTLRNCTQLREVRSLRKCTYLEQVDLNGCTQLQSLRGLFAHSSLQYLNLFGCHDIDLEEAWALAVHLGGRENAGLVWPSFSSLTRLLEKHRKPRAIACLVVRVSRKGAEQWLNSELAEVQPNNLQIRHAMEYASALSCDVRHANERLNSTE